MAMLDVDNIASEADVANVAGGAAELARILPEDWAGTARIARALAWDEIVDALGAESPTIRESDLANPAQFKALVVHGTLALVYMNASHDAADPFAAKAAFHRSAFKNGLGRLAPQLKGGGRASPLSAITLHRR